MTISAFSAPMIESLKPGKVTLNSAGRMTFGPDGILFVADWLDGKVVAIDTADRTPVNSPPLLDVKAIDQKVAAILGTTSDRLLIEDVVVNPISKNIYMSVSRGRGPDMVPVVLRMDASGKLSEVSLDNIPYSVSILPNPVPVDLVSKRDISVAAAAKKEKQSLYVKVDTLPAYEKGRTFRVYAITDMKYADGKLYVAGLSNEEFSSSFRVIPFPFPDTVDDETGVMMYHSSHGRFETNSPIRSFALTTVDNQPTIFAGYTCSPLVKIPVSQLQPGGTVRGYTVSELGGGNTPLDILVYRKANRNYILVAGTRPVFNAVQRLPLDGMENALELTANFPDSGGMPFEVVPGMDGVVQVDHYGADHLMLVSKVNGSLNLTSVPTP
jgi:hypothetical protein